MRRIGLVLMCLAACDKGSHGSASGSAYPTPTGPPELPPPLLPAPDAEPPHIIESQPMGLPPTLSPTGGLSTLGRMDMGNPDLEEIERKVGLPNVTVTQEVMDIPGSEYREEGYWAVRRGDKELIRLLRGKNAVLAVVVLSPEVPTLDGTKVGDPRTALRAKHHDLACKGQRIVNTVYEPVVCRSPKEKALGYIIDDKDLINGIVHEF